MIVTKIAHIDGWFNEFRQGRDPLEQDVASPENNMVLEDQNIVEDELFGK
jgi:hypothetical protein